MNEAPTATTPNATTAMTPTATNPSTTPQPTLDTTGSDVVSMYEPSLKKGRQTRLCKILDFTPGKKQDTGEYYGWSISLALAEEADDELGGKVAVGTRLQRATLFTLPNAQRDARAAAVQVQGYLMGLNNIPIDRRNQASCRVAEQAYRALDPSKRLPAAHDEEPAHYEQWKEGYVKAVLFTKENKQTGEVQTNVVELLARDSA